MPAPPPGPRAAGLGVRHFLDEIPTEIHVFLAIWTGTARVRRRRRAAARLDRASRAHRADGSGPRPEDVSARGLIAAPHRGSGDHRKKGLIMRHALLATLALATAASAQPPAWRPAPVAGAHRARRGDRQFGRVRLAAGRPRESARSWTSGRQWKSGGPGDHRARPRFRAGPCRQHAPLRPRRLVERRHHLPGAGQLCRAMGQWRCRGADARRRGRGAAGRI